jgi:hypothetical protein
LDLAVPVAVLPVRADRVNQPLFLPMEQLWFRQQAAVEVMVEQSVVLDNTA